MMHPLQSEEARLPRKEKRIEKRPQPNIEVPGEPSSNLIFLCTLSLQMELHWSAKLDLVHHIDLIHFYSLLYCNILIDYYTEPDISLVRKETSSLICRI